MYNKVNLTEHFKKRQIFAPDQLLRDISDILFYKIRGLQTIITCFLAISRIKLLPKMDKLEQTPAINIIFTVTHLK